MENRRIFGRAAVSGILAGALVGTAVVVLTGNAVAHTQAAAGSAPLLEATHLPMLLTTRGRPVELRYDVYCSSGDEMDARCDATGTVFVRGAGQADFLPIALSIDEGAAEGRYVARVPEQLARSREGFSYYAVFEYPSAGPSITLPAGGAAAPQRSVPLDDGTTISLGAHAFGRLRAANARVVEAGWGSGPSEVGLEDGRNLAPIGGSSFDVAADGVVHVLDEANRRVQRWSFGASTPEHVRLPIRGTLADLAVAEDGTSYVLETAAEPGRPQVLREFRPSGAPRRSIPIPGRAAAVRLGAEGPLTLQQPSGQWMRATAGTRALDAREQQRTGRSGRPLPGGGQLVVLRVGNEARIALVGENGARRSWRIQSETPLAEVQLAEPLGEDVVVVVRAYTDTESEFLVLLLGRDGLVRRFAVAAADWAETAPLSRFRLAGSSLYQLGSTPRGLFVDRFDLEVR